MSQLKLITNDESVEDLCELIKALHAEMVEMRAEMQRGFDVLLAVKTDDTEALREMIVSAKVSVVPFEDEALPALATCPQCEAKAETEEQVEERFGYRTMEDGKVRVQSWCRSCRSQGEKVTANSERKPRLRMPPEIRALSTEATRLQKDGKALIEEAMQGASQRPGNRMSLEDQAKLERGSKMVAEGKAKQSKYNKLREKQTYPNGRNAK